MPWGNLQLPAEVSRTLSKKGNAMNTETSMRVLSNMCMSVAVALANLRSRWQFHCSFGLTLLSSHEWALPVVVDRIRRHTWEDILQLCEYELYFRSSGNWCLEEGLCQSQRGAAFAETFPILWAAFYILVREFDSHVLNATYVDTDCSRISRGYHWHELGSTTSLLHAWTFSLIRVKTSWIVPWSFNILKDYEKASQSFP